MKSITCTFNFYDGSYVRRLTDDFRKLHRKLRSRRVTITIFSVRFRRILREKQLRKCDY